MRLLHTHEKGNTIEGHCSCSNQHCQHTIYTAGERKHCSGWEKYDLPALVGDATASVPFQMWGSECETFEPGNIIHLADRIFSYHKNNLVLRTGKRGKAEKVGEFTMLFVETPNISEI